MNFVIEIYRFVYDNYYYGLYIYVYTQFYAIGKTKKMCEVDNKIYT